MAKVLIIGGGFGGLVAADSLAKRLGRAHQITLVSRSSQFVFSPALVRLAFGKCEPHEIVCNLHEAMLDRRIRFMVGEVARINLQQRQVTLAHGDLVGELLYDFLVLAPGRRLATEQVTGFFENSHHLLSVDAALKFGAAVRNFHQGQAVLGSCPDARLPVPAFEAAFALSRQLQERGERDRAKITIVSSETTDEMFGGIPLSKTLLSALAKDDIELISDFPITRVTENSVGASDDRAIACDLRMLIPPFRGPAPLMGQGVTDEEGYARVDTSMRVTGVEQVYAVGDCVSFKGPKLGHMAVRQARVAAENLAEEIGGRAPTAAYEHELMLVIDAYGEESIFAHKDLWTDAPANIGQSRFWAWAKRLQENYWETRYA